MSTVLNFPEIAEAPATTEPATDRAEIKDGNVLVQYSATEAGLAALRSDLAGKTYDLKTTKGDQAARADRLRCVTMRTTLEKKRKEFKAPALLFGERIDAEAKRITAEIKALETPIDAQIVADEQRRADEKADRERLEAERVAKHRAGIETIRGYVAQAEGRTAKQIGAAIDRIAALRGAFTEEGFKAYWQEFSSEAEAAWISTEIKLNWAHTKAVESEAEAARIEAQRIEHARVAAEQAETQRKLDEQAAAIQRQIDDLAAQQAAVDAATKPREQALSIFVAKGVLLDPAATSLDEAYGRANAVIAAQNSQRQESVVPPAQAADAAPEQVEAVLGGDPSPTSVASWVREDRSGSVEVTAYLPASTAAAPLPGPEPVTQTTLQSDDGDDDHAEDLYWRLHSLSTALESSGIIDAHDYPDAYATILDAMIFVRAAEPAP